MLRYKTKITFSFLASLFLHVLVLGSLIYFQIQRDKSTMWSGGRGDGSKLVAYVDLGSFEFTSDDAPSSLVSRPSSQSKLKIKKKIKKKRSVSKKKLGGQKNSGIGDSDTPAGGIGPGLDPDGIISKTAPNTLAMIRKKIMRKKNYPLIAKENKWTGSVKLSFKINKSGSLDFVKIIKSSGYEILDSSALNSIKSAAPMPFYPDVIALSLEYRIE